MIFIILFIAAIILLIVNFKVWEEAWLYILLFFVMCFCSIGCLSSIGLYERSCEDIQAIQLSAAHQYEESSHTSEDWDWVVSQCEYANTLVTDLESNSTCYAWIDVFYLVNKDDMKGYIAEISENNITFPQHYNHMPLHR